MPCLYITVGHTAVPRSHAERGNEEEDTKT